MVIFIILLTLFLFCTFVYVILMVFYPEWVGISGKTAKRMEEEQRDRKE